MTTTPDCGPIVCIGIAAFDFVFGLDALPTAAIKYRARQLSLVGGGHAATAAVAIARLGGKAHLLARIGDDTIGRLVVDDLQADGVDTGLVSVHPGCLTSTSAVLVDAAGERQVINFFDPKFPTEPPIGVMLPPDTGAVLGDCKWPQGAIAMFRQARERGIPAVLDGDMPTFPPELLELATIAAFSRQALEESMGTRTIADGLNALARRTDAVAVVTDGADGVFWLQDGSVRHLPAFPVKAVDTLGAGDVFHGALALAAARGASTREALRFASATAAIKVTRFGGRAGTPTAAEVAALLAR